jgi:hypothetical protein
MTERAKPYCHKFINSKVCLKCGWYPGDVAFTGAPCVPAESAPAPTEGDYPDPLPSDLERPEFEAVWQAIKGWDIQRSPGQGYAGATGNDVMHILKALGAASAIGRAGETEAEWSVRCLDVWAEKHEQTQPPTPVFHRYMHSTEKWSLSGVVVAGLSDRRFDSAAVARIAAARALYAADPTLPAPPNPPPVDPKGHPL